MNRYSRKDAVAGRKRLRSMRIAVCSAARDCAPALRRNLELLKKAFKNAQSVDWVFSENDSKDETLEVLKNFQASTENVHILDGPLTIEPFADDDVGADGYTRGRIRRMCSCRNRYLEFLQKNILAKVDVVVIADLDVQTIPESSIHAAFSSFGDWDVLCANGLMYFGRQTGYQYFDTFAVRLPGENPVITLESIGKRRVKLQKLLLNRELVKVESAFSGLSFYRAPVLEELRYELIPNVDSQVRALCEHESICNQIQAAGHDRIFIDPCLIMFYQSRLGYYLQRVLQLLGR